jgi:thiamine-phosphate pyrophosphorylase
VDAEASRERDLAWVAHQAILGGADVIQLRDKRASTRQLLEEARRVRDVTRPAGVPLIINDRVDLTLAVEAEGVHLGQEDLPVPVAKRLMGAGKLVGCSTHSVEQALEAERAGADYLAVGPIYPTPTKPGYGSVGLGLIARVRAQTARPMVCIGGIDHATLPEVLQAGAECVAVVRAVCAAEDPAAAARALKQLLLQSVVPH